MRQGERPSGWRGTPRAALGVVWLAIFTDMLLYGLAVPILPGRAAALGASESAIGLLFASYALALLVATPVFGALADRVGRRGPMLGGLFGLAAATVLFAFSYDFVSLLVARLLQGVAAAATWTAGLALVADSYPAAKRGWALGVVLQGMTVGLLVGPPLGGWLYELGGFRLPFLVAAALAAVDGLARALLLADPPRGDAPHVSLLDLLRDRQVLVASGLVVVGSGTWALLEPVLPLDLERRFDASPGMVGLLFGVATLAYGLAAPLVGALADHWGRRPSMALGLLLLAATLPLVAWLPALPLVGAALVGVSVAYGFALTPTLPALADAVDRRGGGAYASAYALFNEAYSAGMLLGPLAGGVLAEWLGLPAALLLLSMMVLACLPLLKVGWSARAG